MLALVNTGKFKNQLAEIMLRKYGFVVVMLDGQLDLVRDIDIEFCE